MLPEKAELWGFLGHAGKVELDFGGSDLWLLIGPNGSGKSSVFDAITFALFEGHRGDGRAIEPLLNRCCDEGGVRFTFQLEDNSYRITRSLKRHRDGSVRGDKAIFEREGPGGWDIVDKEELKNRLGLDKEAFEASLLLRQGNAEALLGKIPSERYQILRNIIGLEEYQKLCDKAKEKLRHVQGARDRKPVPPAVSPDEIAGIQNKLRDAEAEEEKARTALKDVNRVCGLVEDLDRENRQVQDLEKLLEQEESIKQKAQRLQELRRARPWLRQVPSARERREAALKEITEIREEVTDIVRDTAGFAPLNSTEISSDEYAGLVRDYHDRAERIWMDAATRLRQSKEQCRKVEERKKWLETAAPGTLCDRCHQGLSHEHLAREKQLTSGDVAAARREENDAETALNSAEALWKRLRDLPSRYDAAIKEQAGADETLIILLQELTTEWQSPVGGWTEEDDQRIGEEIRRLADDNAEDRLTQLIESGGQLRAHQQRITELRGELSLIPARLSQLSLEEVEQAAAEAEQDFQEKQRERQRLGHDLADLQKRADEWKKAQAADGLLRVEEGEWDELARYLGREGLQRQLLRAAEQQIVRQAGETLDRLWPGQTLHLISSGQEAKELELEIRSSSDERRHVKYLSGSERFRVAISLAMAIGAYSNLSGRPAQSVIIDEGFGCLDEDNRRGMIEELRRLCQKNVVKRILVVSHQDEFAEGIPDHFRFQQGDDGVTYVARRHG